MQDKRVLLCWKASLSALHQINDASLILKELLTTPRPVVSLMLSCLLNRFATGSVAVGATERPWFKQLAPAGQWLLVIGLSAAVDVSVTGAVEAFRGLRIRDYEGDSHFWTRLCSFNFVNRWNDQRGCENAKPLSRPATKTCLVMFLRHLRFIPETGVKPWGRYLVIKKLLTLAVINLLLRLLLGTLGNL